MPYAKPFKELELLVSDIRTLGMAVPDEAHAVGFFRRVGYYRSGGYRYVLRELLPESQRDVRARSFRKDSYRPGSSIDHVIELERFDSRLRDVCLVGLWDFEMRARAAIAHVLARRDVFAHTSLSHLDRREASKVTGSNGATKFTEWETTYKNAIKSAAQEDFIAHLIVRYGHPLPIWAVIDVLSFGSLPYLYDIMQRDDRREVARAFGVTQETRFGAWLRSMVDFRNYCAHGSRIFNRHFKREISVVPGAIDVLLLGHVVGSAYSPSENPPSRIYVNAAVLAYMLTKHASGSVWQLQFRTQMRKLPQIAIGGVPLVDPGHNMGFPSNWEQLDLWKA